MNKEILKKLLPSVVAVLIFLIISFAYFPAFLDGKELLQHDVKTWKGGAQEIFDYKEKSGEHSHWTNSMFGGMPAYLITNYSPDNVAVYIYKAIDFNNTIRPVSFVFLYLLCFYIGLLLFGVDPWLSIVGAIAYGFSSYFLIIIEAGHITKVIALSFMPGIIGGVYYAYNKNAIVGAVISMIFLALQVVVNHVQITYYTVLILLIFLIFRFFEDLKNKQLNKFLKTSGILGIASIIAVLTNFSQLAVVYDYSKDSIRGKSELTSEAGNKTSGLDKDYATAWSYGKMESFNLLIPNLMGGASGGALSTDSEVFNELKNYDVENPKEIIKQMPTYWGPQPFTSGPVYIGAVVIFLFVLGLFLVKGNLRWWLLTATALSIMLAWGKNFMFLTDLFLDYFPMYNKFRSVSMTLIIAQFTMPLLGILAIKTIMDKQYSKQEIIKALKYSLGIVGGLILLLLVFMPSFYSFTNENDSQNGLPEQLLPALISDRKALFKSDAIRSIVFVILGAALIFLYVREKLKLNYFIAGLALLVLVDLWAVDKRYLNDDDFQKKSRTEVPFTASNADNFILKDKDPNFRVLNLTVSTFNDASTSYFHKSVGGYHGAKMRRYQELIDSSLTREMGVLIGALQSKEASQATINQVMKGLSAINMLNTKYFILNKEMPMTNDFRLGNAWFVEKIEEVANADEEIKKLKNFDPSKTALVDTRFKNQFFTFTKDSTSKIELKEYKPNYLKYKSSASSDQLAVFSEIYYAKGWQAYIDGNKSDHFRANYVLRAMKVPAGDHTIEFKFESSIRETGDKISFIASVVFILLIAGSIYIILKNRKTITN